MSAPLVSIVIPCFNQGDFVEEAIQSVLRSSFKNIEIIVVDDGSTDDATRAVFDSVRELNDVRVIHQENRGLSGARNIGIKNAKGKYIVPLDADDLLEPTFITKAVWHLERNPDLSIVYSLVKLFGDVEELWVTEPFDPVTLLHHNYIPATAVFRKKVWLETDGYDEKMRGGYEDWEFWIRCVTHGFKGKRLNEPLFFYRRHGTTMLTRSREKHAEIVTHIRNKHGSLYNGSWRIRLLSRYSIRRARRAGSKVRRSVKGLATSSQKKRLKWLYRKVAPLRLKQTPQRSENRNGVNAFSCPTDGKVDVLIVLPWMQTGGVESMFLNLLSRIDRSRFRIHLFTTVYDDNPWKHRFLPLVHSLIHLPDSFGTEQEQIDFVCDYIEGNHVRCVHISNSQFFYRALPVLKPLFPAITFFDTLHMEEPNEPWDYFRFSQAVKDYLDYRVVITETLRTRLISVYGELPEKIRVIENGIPVEQLLSKRDELTTEFPSGPVLFVGRFVDQKQPLLFVDIAREVIRVDPSVSFQMVGDGPLLSEVQRKIEQEKLSSNISLLGYRSDVLDFLSRASVLVAPSLREGLPILGLEAMAMRVPVVAAAVNGWTDLIVSGEDGILVNQTDVGQYTHGIISLMSDVNSRKAIVENAFRKVTNRYNADRMVQKYEVLYSREN